VKFQKKRFEGNKIHNFWQNAYCFKKSRNLTKFTQFWEKISYGENKERG
jgi:hypothetical protein